MAFRRDLEVGKTGEALLIKKLTELGLMPVQYDGKRQDVAFEFDDKVYTCEVKYDLYAAKSGNIAIEFYNPKAGKSSGIGSTEADLWVHIITKPMGIHVTTVKKLKAFVDTQKPHRVISVGGDDNASLFLYKQDIILPLVFIELQTLENLKDAIQL